MKSNRAVTAPCLRVLARIGFLLLLMLPPIFARLGQVQAAAPPVPQEWLELRTGYFAVIYPPELESLAQSISSSLGQALDGEYERFSAVFDDHLNVPVSLRIYPTIYHFKELNPLTPSVSWDSLHSHVGSREIALFADNIKKNPGWMDVAVNHVRYELAVLFIEHIADLKAPPGLLAGVGWYAQDPGLGLEQRSAVLKRGALPLVKYWQTVLEDRKAFADPGVQVDCAAIVAYLVDTYGWTGFLDFLKTISTSDSYVSALSATFVQNPEELQAGWEHYLPKFLGSRWEKSIFYTYDLTRYEQMIAAGAYSAAEQELEIALDLLVRTNQAAGAASARNLYEQARQGRLAGDLALQARQALTGGDFEKAIYLTDLALERFTLAGNLGRQAELEQYKDRAEEVLALREEARAIEERFASGGLLAPDLPRLREIGSRLAVLGDQNDVDQVNSLFARDRSIQQQKQLRLNLVMATILLVLAGLRIRIAFRRPPLEANIR